MNRRSVVICLHLPDGSAVLASTADRSTVIAGLTLEVRSPSRLGPPPLDMPPPPPGHPATAFVCTISYELVGLERQTTISLLEGQEIAPLSKATTSPVTGTRSLDMD